MLRGLGSGRSELPSRVVGREMSGRPAARATPARLPLLALVGLRGKLARATPTTCHYVMDRQNLHS